MIGWMLVAYICSTLPNSDGTRECRSTPIDTYLSAQACVDAGEYRLQNYNSRGNSTRMWMVCVRTKRN
jgi:hypothetical protein